MHFLCGMNFFYPFFIRSCDFSFYIYFYNSLYDIWFVSSPILCVSSCFPLQTLICRSFFYELILSHFSNYYFLFKHIMTCTLPHASITQCLLLYYFFFIINNLSAVSFFHFLLLHCHHTQKLPFIIYLSDIACHTFFFLYRISHFS